MGWLSWLAVISLTVATVLCYAVPARYLVLVWGLYKMTAKLRHPGVVHHVGLLDFLARVPSNRQLVCTYTYIQIYIAPKIVRTNVYDAGTV